MDWFFEIFAQTFATFAVNGFQLLQQPQSNTKGKKPINPFLDILNYDLECLISFEK